MYKMKVLKKKVKLLVGIFIFAIIAILGAKSSLAAQASPPLYIGINELMTEDNPDMGYSIGQPTASDGAGVFMIASVSMILTALSQTLTGGLYGVNQSKIPAIAAGLGAVIKFILNMILISNPNIGIYGAAISSFIYQVIVFFICYNVMNRCVNMHIKFKTHILKPVISALGMGVIVFLGYRLFSSFLGNTVSTVLSILLGAISYCLLILFTKSFTKEDIMMIPYGTKIYGVLVKFRIYKEEREPLK